MEIVLIEDNDDDALRILKFLKANVTNPIRLIQDGAKAVEFLLFECDNVPKLILLDTVLPSVDAIDIFNMIRSEPKKRNLFVIFLISSVESKEYFTSRGLRPDGFLIKPVGEGPPIRIAC